MKYEETFLGMNRIGKKAMCVEKCGKYICSFRLMKFEAPDEMGKKA